MFTGIGVATHYDLLLTSNHSHAKKATLGQLKEYPNKNVQDTISGGKLELTQFRIVTCLFVIFRLLFL